MCPQRQDVCSTSQNVTFTEIDQSQNITIIGMSTGESCTYKIRSKKGSPCFKLSNDSTADDTKVNITFVEFDNRKVNKTGSASGSSSSPEDGMPARNQSFENSGKQGNSTKGGQQLPARKKKDGGMTRNESMSEEKEYLEDQERQRN